jgi:hypothetical protein
MLSRSSSPGLTGRPSIPETAVLEPTGRGVLDAPLSRSMTREGETRMFVLAARNVRAIQIDDPRKHRGCRECRMRDAPVAACAVKKAQASATTGTPQSTGIPCAMVLTVSFVLSPGTGLYCPRHQRIVPPT